MQIHRSTARNNIGSVKYLLDKGVPIDVLEEPGGIDQKTPLMYACESHRASVDILRFLVSRGANINAVSTGLENTPLRLAARAGNVEKVRYLLEAGADLHFHSSSGYTALIDAVHGATYQKRSSSNEVIQLLIASGADLDCITEYGESTLRLASLRGKFKLVKNLLDAGTNPAPLKWTDLMCAIVLGSCEEVSKELGKGTDLTVRDSWERTPWLLSCQVGDVSKAQALLQAGSNKDDRGRCGKTSLMFAAENDHVDMAQWLIREGIAPNITDQFGKTALMTAAQYGSLRCLEALLEAGANSHALDAVGANAISKAANPEIVRLLVAAGVDVNFGDGEGYGLLKRASEDGDLELVNALLKMGAGIETTSTGDTALHAAVKADELEIIELLLKAGANPNARDVDGATPLFYVESAEAVCLLLAAGADVTIVDECGHIPLECHKDPEILAALNTRSGS